MTDLVPILLVIGGLYLLSQSTGGPVQAGVVPPGGGPAPGGPPPGSGPRPTGTPAGPGVGTILLAPITKIGQDLFRQATGQSPPIPPRVDAANGLVPVAGDTTMFLDVPLFQYTEEQIAALAAQAGTTPAHLLDAAASMGASPADAAAVMQGAAAEVGAGAGEAAVGAAGAAYVGWAVPAALAIAIGTMILKSALSRRGSFGESKDAARRKLAAFGKLRAYSVANQVLDTLLATNRVPSTFSQELAIQSGLVFSSWYENADSLKDVFGDDADNAALLTKVRAYYGRIGEMQGWWGQVLYFVQQADQTWGRDAAPQFYIGQIGQHVPPPTWLRDWKDFHDLTDMGYPGMIAFIRAAVYHETVGRWAGGNA